MAINAIHLGNHPLNQNHGNLQQILESVTDSLRSA